MLTVTPIFSSDSMAVAFFNVHDSPDKVVNPFTGGHLVSSPVSAMATIISGACPKCKGLRTVVESTTYHCKKCDKIFDNSDIESEHKSTYNRIYFNPISNIGISHMSNLTFDSVDDTMSGIVSRFSTR